MTFSLRQIKSVLFSAVVALLACTVIAAVGNVLIGTASAASGTVLGDADGDGEITINDVTAIQRTLALLPVIGEYSEQAADVDGSGVVNISDATYIQRWLAEMDTPYQIGEPIEAPTDTTVGQTTEATTQSPTDADGWGRDIIRP